VKTFNKNALVIGSGKVNPFDILVHAIRRNDQKSLVLIEDIVNQNVLAIASTDGIHRTIELLEVALKDLRERLK